MFTVKNLENELEEVLSLKKSEMKVNEVFGIEVQLVEEILDYVLELSNFESQYFETADSFVDKITEEEMFKNRYELEDYISEILLERDGQLDCRNSLDELEGVFQGATFRYLYNELCRNTKLILTYYVLSNLLLKVQGMDQSKEIESDDFSDVDDFVDYVVTEIESLLEKKSYSNTCNLDGVEDEYLDLLV